jgi:hypothetical protein
MGKMQKNKLKDAWNWFVDYSKGRNTFLYKKSYEFLAIPIIPLPSKYVCYGVYIAKGKDGEIIYVGCSNIIRERLKKHKYKSPWWKYVSTIETKEFPTRKEALEEEERLIVSLSPMFNIHGKRNKKR